MFRTTSCVVRENDGDRSRHLYTKDLDTASSLQYVKTLCIRKALRTNDDDPATTATPPEQLEELRCQDMQSMQQHLALMPQLQLVR